MTRTTMQVAVIGGGIGGLSAAIALRRQGAFDRGVPLTSTCELASGKQEALN